MYESDKSLGQNFLTDANTIISMVDALQIETDDLIIEIGPGLGVLTEELAKRMGFFKFKTIAVEIDSRFIAKLNSMFSLIPDIKIIEGDILTWLPQFKSDRQIKILGALPFNISSPILHVIVKMNMQPSLAVLMLQKEVANKLLTDAPDSSYLGVFVRTFFEVTKVVDVTSEKFSPEPDVEATIITLKHKGIFMSRPEIEKYEGFLHRGFASPRKMLNKQFSGEELGIAGIDPSLRAEAISTARWLDFFNKQGRNIA